MVCVMSHCAIVSVRRLYFLASSGSGSLTKRVKWQGWPLWLSGIAVGITMGLDPSANGSLFPLKYPMARSHTSALVPRLFRLARKLPTEFAQIVGDGRRDQ
jgi:hypothetical protein